MDVYENGVVIVEDDDDNVDVDPMSDNLDLQGGDSRHAGASSGTDLIANSTVWWFWKYRCSNKRRGGC